MGTKTNQPNIIGNLAQKIDNFQQSHKPLGFVYAVIKKYGDDGAADQGALITYYGFLSLFPLLFVVTSFIQLAFRHNSELQAKLAASINHYFPVVGSQLQHNIHSSTRTGLTVLLGLVITFYGAKGVADALQKALNHLWLVPKSKRAGFPKATLRSLAIIIGGGSGLLVAATLSSYATSLGHSFIFKLVPTIISVSLLFGVFLLVIKLGTSRRLQFRTIALGAAMAAIGIQILQTIGGYLITHELKNLSSSYGTFAVVLGILFWIYLQTEVLLYAVEIETVRSFRLWPRSLTQKPATSQDRKALEIYAKRDM